MDALNRTQSPENGTVWVTADRVNLRASHASSHVNGQWLTSPRGLRPHRVDQRSGSNPGVQSTSWAAVPEYDPATSQERIKWGLCNGTGPGVAMKRLIPVEQKVPRAIPRERGNTDTMQGVNTL